MAMVVAGCRVHLQLPGSDSLKGKRRRIRSVIDRLRHQFNVSVAEVDEQDRHDRAVLGIAVVSSDRRVADRLVARAMNWIREHADGVLWDYQVEFY